MRVATEIEGRTYEYGEKNKMRQVKVKSTQRRTREKSLTVLKIIPKTQGRREHARADLRARGLADNQKWGKRVADRKKQNRKKKTANPPTGGAIRL